MAAPVQDDLIIKKRLYTHTIALRGEPPLKKVARKYLGITKDLKESAPEDVEAAYLAFVKEVAQYEFVMRKAEVTKESNQRDQAKCSETMVEVSTTCDKVTNDIARLREELEAARLERQHKEEYEALRKLCMEFPSRAASREAIAKLRAGMAALEAEGLKAEATLELRRKQFQLLLHTVDQLANQLEEEAIAEEEARDDAEGGGDDGMAE
mmetsp:Transcript_29998/g.96214  ORF Transcript_29998/g.96214 Transcript_29998/m.96214 type:complete len:210 (+) Transcript_29998:205-834(+)